MNRIFLPAFLLFGTFLLSAQTPESEPPRSHPAVQTLIAWAESQNKEEPESGPKLFEPGDLKKIKEEMGPGGEGFEKRLSQTILADRDNLTFRFHENSKVSGTVFSKKQPVFPMTLQGARSASATMSQ